MSDASETGQLDSIGARLTALPAAVDGDPGLLRRGRWLNATCQLDDDTYLLHIVAGRLAEIRPGPFVTPRRRAGDAPVESQPNSPGRGRGPFVNRLIIG